MPRASHWEGYCFFGLVGFLYEILGHSPNLLQAGEKTSAWFLKI